MCFGKELRVQYYDKEEVGKFVRLWKGEVEKFIGLWKDEIGS